MFGASEQPPMTPHFPVLGRHPHAQQALQWLEGKCQQQCHSTDLGDLVA